MKIAVHFGKKVPIANVGYSSQQFGASVELDVADAEEAEQTQLRLRRLFDVVQKSVDEQVASVAKGGTNGNGNGSGEHRPAAPAGRATVANGAKPSNGGGRFVPATAAQGRAIHAICKERGIQVADVLAPYNVTGVDGLGLRDASKVIDQLKKGQPTNG